MEFWNIKKEKAQSLKLWAFRNLLKLLNNFGGADGTRTRDPRRDRPVF